MSKFWSLFFLVTVCLSSTLNAKSKSTISRGGLGFLFPDANSFNNAGQLALNKGFSVQAAYTQSETSGVSTVAATPSAVYANGAFALGGFATRAGLSLTEADQYATIVGGGLGVATGKGKFTFGGTFYKTLEEAFSTDSGTVAAGFNINGGSKGSGAVFGASAGMKLNATPDTKFATVGLGYGFKGNTNVEANVYLPDITNFDDMTLGGYFTWAGETVYLGGGFSYAKLTQTSSASGRLGFVLGGKVDFSGTVTFPFQSGSNPSFGGTLRASF